MKRLIVIFMCLLFSRVAYSESFTQKQTLILKQVLAADGQINKELYGEFWAEVPVINIEEWTPLQKWFIGQTAFLHEYQKELWESLLISIVYGKEVKTERLIKLEGELNEKINEEVPFSKKVSDYPAFSESFESNMKESKETARRMLQSITDKNSFTSVNGETIALDEKFIKTILKKMDESFIRLKALLNPEWPGAGENHLTQCVTLRSSYKKLSVSQVQAIKNISINRKHEKGFYGYSTVNHNYVLKTISGDRVVVDHITSLMWHQSGAVTPMTWREAKLWVSDLNSREYAGYHDWRLPALDEAVSLLEMSKKNGDLYIDSIFDNKQRWIWTGDSYVADDAAWGVYFTYGLVAWYGENYFCVRPVRTLEQRDIVSWLFELFDNYCLFFSL